MLICRAFIVLSVCVIILVLTVIEKEYHDSRLAQLERRQYQVDNVTIRYGTGTGDSEKGVGAGGLEK
jgi:hypothetical protein